MSNGTRVLLAIIGGVLRHLATQPNLDATPLELLDGSGDQAPPIFDHPACEVGYPALAVGGEGALVVGDDLGVRIRPPRFGPRAHAGRIGPGDDESLVLLLVQACSVVVTPDTR